jgi:hypothetical protein
VWKAAGLDVIITEDPNDVEKFSRQVAFLGADEFDRNLVSAALRSNPSLRAVMWTAESVGRLVRFMLEHPGVTSILGRPSFDTTPDPWELSMVARRMMDPADTPLSAEQFLAYGAGGIDVLVPSTAAMDAAVAQTQATVERLQLPSWFGDTVGELTHELLMNALYDAPVDSTGRPRFAHDRKAAVEVAMSEAPRLQVYTDGIRLCVRVSDPFGRLTRAHVFEGLARGLREGEVDRSGGGAGLGMAVCHNSCLSIVYDVAPEAQTDVTAFLDLELNRRDFRSRARSVHFYERRIPRETHREDGKQNQP